MLRYRFSSTHSSWVSTARAGTSRRQSRLRRGRCASGRACAHAGCVELPAGSMSGGAGKRGVVEWVHAGGARLRLHRGAAGADELLAVVKRFLRYGRWSESLRRGGFSWQPSRSISEKAPMPRRALPAGRGQRPGGRRAVGILFAAASRGHACALRRPGFRALPKALIAGPLSAPAASRRRGPGPPWSASAAAGVVERRSRPDQHRAGQQQKHFRVVEP